MNCSNIRQFFVNISTLYKNTILKESENVIYDRIGKSLASVLTLKKFKFPNFTSKKNNLNSSLENFPKFLLDA